MRAASVRAGRARRDRRGAGADRRPRGGGRQQTGGCGCAGGKRAGAERPRPRAGADRRGAGADRRPGGGCRQQTGGRGRRPQDRRPLGGADRRRAGAGADRRPQTRAQTADGAGADRRRTPALGHYVLERSGRTCGRGAHPATVPVASSATGGVSPVDEAERRF